MAEPLQLPADKMAALAGYPSERAFRLAVERGVVPPPKDPRARPQLWSVAEVTMALSGTVQPMQTSSEEDFNDRLFGT